MTADRTIRVTQIAFVGLVFAFIYLPIVSLIAFSINSNRFPSLPWTGFSLEWYRDVFSDPTITEAFFLSIVVAAGTAVTATLLGFLGAYADYRWRFRGKQLYLAIIILPPTIPFIVLGLAMLIFLKADWPRGDGDRHLHQPHDPLHSVRAGSHSNAAFGHAVRPRARRLEPRMRPGRGRPPDRSAVLLSGHCRRVADHDCCVF